MDAVRPADPPAAAAEDGPAPVAGPAGTGTVQIDLAWVLLLYAGLRLAQLAAVRLLAPAGGPPLRDRLLAWDGGWWVRVATQGYPHGYSYDANGAMLGNGLAFFPLYPLTIWLAHALGVPAGLAAVAIAALAGALACVLLYLLAVDLSGPRLGYALVVLFAAQPMSVVLSMGYSEALFSALVLGMLLAARRGYWLTAGAAGLAAALTRPTGLAAAVALAVAAALAVRRATVPRWRPVLAAAVALCGVPGYLAWVALRVGEPDAWFKIETAGWGTTTDGGAATLRFMLDTLHRGDGWIPVSIVLLLIAATAASVLAAVRRTWPPLTVYGLLVLGLVLGQAGYYHSKVRLLVPAVLLLVPAGYAAARARTLPAVLALAGYAAFGLWYGAYMITVWHYAI